MSPVALRFAVRNLRQGLAGFRIFLACIALGVTAIVGVDSIARALNDGLVSEGRTLLGADLVASRMHRPADPSERTILTHAGTVSEVIGLRAMARASDDAALVDLKVVDDAYPLIGTPGFDPPLSLADALQSKNGLFGAVADAALLTRLAIKPGDTIALGDARIEVRASLVSEPDRIGAGFTFGPRLMITRAALETTGLIHPESLIRYSYRLVLTDARDENVQRVETRLTDALAANGFEIRSRQNVSPQLSRNIERFAQYLGLIGLMALIIGGLGVANAVTAYSERRRVTMATLKAIGATGATIFHIAFLEIMLLSSLGVAIGLALGGALPFVISSLAASFLPFPLAPHLYFDRLALGAALGLLAAGSFVLPILGRLHDVPVATLFRDDVSDSTARLRMPYRIASAISALSLIGLILLTAHDRIITALILGGVAVTYIVLRAVAAVIMVTAKKMPHPHRAEWRLALGNIHRPGAITPALTLALGLGVTLLVLISATQDNLVRLVTAGLPAKAPGFFFVDIPARDLETFDRFLTQQSGDAKISHVPMLRGRITAVKSSRAEDVKADENARWVLDGDRGITYSTELPEGSRLIEGKWWSADYADTPLVSLEAEIAKGLGLQVGDTITVNVLGRSITATIANLRRVDWQSLGINFVLVFSPNTFKGAPVSYLATLTPGQTLNTPEEEAKLIALSARTFPAISAIRVREALETVRTMIDQLALAIRGVAGVTIIASVLVLAGAVGASQRRRIKDAVILKTLGATRLRLLAAFLAEFAIISLAAGIFGLISGLLAAWAMIVFAFRTVFTWPVSDPLLTAGGAILLAISLGLLGTGKVLNEKPARHLRAP